MVFSQNQNKSLQKPIFSDFGLTHTDVFFDEESESDLIFNDKLTPKGLKIDLLLETQFSKKWLPLKNTIFDPLGVKFCQK